MKIYTVFDLSGMGIVGVYEDGQDAYRTARREIQDIIEGEGNEFYPNEIEIDQAAEPYRMSYVDDEGEKMDYMLIETTAYHKRVKLYDESGGELK